MIRLLGPQEDATLRYFERYLLDEGLEHHRHTWGDVYEALSTADAGFLQGFADSGVFIREPPQISLHSYALMSTLYAHLRLSGRRAIFPQAESTNWSKPLHYYRLRGALTRVRIPSWVCASTSDAGTDAESGHRTIAKPASSLSGIACSGRAYRYADSPYPTPFLSQERKHGRDIRVHVIGDEVVAAAVEKPESCVDYKELAEISTTLVTLPADVVTDCRAAAQTENAIFSGIDLIHDGDAYWMLEVNPMPGYHTFESGLADKTKPVSEMLVSYLIGTSNNEV